MPTIAPEEIIAAGLAPMQQAVSQYANGQTDLAKLRYLNGVKQIQDDRDFARQAQEARALFALHQQASNVAAERQAKYVADREDARAKASDERQRITQKGMDERQAATIEASEKRQAADIKARLEQMDEGDKQRTIRELITKNGLTLARNPGQTSDDYIMSLLKAKDDKENTDAEDAAKTILSYDQRINEHRDAVKQAAATLVTPDVLEKSFLAAAIARKVGIDEDGNLLSDKASIAKKDSLIAQYYKARQTDPKGAARVVFGADSDALRAAVYDGIVNKQAEALMLAPANAKVIEGYADRASQVLNRHPKAAEILAKRSPAAPATAAPVRPALPAPAGGAGVFGIPPARTPMNPGIPASAPQVIAPPAIPVTPEIWGGSDWSPAIQQQNIPSISQLAQPDVMGAFISPQPVMRPMPQASPVNPLFWATR